MLRNNVVVRVLGNERFGRTIQVGLVILCMVVVNFSWYQPNHVGAVGTTNMFLFWDPANTVPACWSVYSAGNGYFPYGASDVAFGTLTATASRPYTPTVASTTVGLPSLSADNVGNTNVSSYLNTHPGSPTVTFGADTSTDAANPDIAAFRSYQLIGYNLNFLSSSTTGCNGSGIPSTIPQNAIALFGSSSVPSGFTRVAAQDGRLIRLNSSVANGGSDSETNTVTVSGLAAGSAVDTRNNAAQVLASNIAHTHAPPPTLTCTTGCAIPTTACTPPGTLSTTGGTASTNTFTCTTTGDVPPYIQPIMAQANADYPTVALNLVTIFNGDPGSGWVVLSNSGGQYYHQFLRPNSSYVGTSQGNSTRIIAVSGTSGPDNLSGNASNAKNNIGGGISATDHTHSIAITSNTVSNMAPQLSVTIAQKVSFTLNAYRWYVDTSAGSTTNTNVTDAWPVGAGLDLAQDTQLPAIPAQYLPPDAQAKTTLRLRVQILVSGQAMTANSTYFKLQYQATGTGDCLSGTWTDVPPYGTAAAPWTYGTSNLTDNQTLTASALTPASTRLETFGRTSTAASGTPTAAATGETIEFDWLIVNNNAASATQYHFRPVERPNPDVTSSATPLSLYQNLSTLKAECPDMITKPGTDQLLRHGEFFLLNPDPTALPDPDQGFAWVD